MSGTLPFLEPVSHVPERLMEDERFKKRAVSLVDFGLVVQRPV